MKYSLMLFVGKQKDEAYSDCSLTSNRKYLLYEEVTFQNMSKVLIFVYLK
jgi:hypothetical protein